MPMQSTKLTKSDMASILRNVVLSANDGIITTFAVVAGVQGAELSHSIVIIVGMANVIADGLSMATGNYMAIKSENEFVGVNQKKQNVSAIKHALLTFIAFVLFGILPLIPYIFKLNNTFLLSTIAVIFSMVLIGVVRGIYTNKSMVRTILETIFVSGIAASSAYLVGYLLRELVGVSGI